MDKCDLVETVLVRCLDVPWRVVSPINYWHSYLRIDVNLENLTMKLNYFPKYSGELSFHESTSVFNIFYGRFVFGLDAYRCDNG